MTPATVATTRGPLRSCHRPPIIVPTPRKKIANVKFNCTWVSVQCSVRISGILNTLQPYTAPRQICMITAATAIPQRFGSRSDAMVIFLLLRPTPGRDPHLFPEPPNYSLLRSVAPRNKSEICDRAESQPASYPSRAPVEPPDPKAPKPTPAAGSGPGQLSG